MGGENGYPEGVDTMLAFDEVRLSRLRDAVERLHIVDTAPEQAFDDIVMLATELCRVPIALVGFMAGGRLVYYGPPAEALLMFGANGDFADIYTRLHGRASEEHVGTGGELAAMVLVDAVARLVPGVIDAESIGEESHSGGLLEYPHYTRPAVWEGREVPEVLRNGHHGQVAQWRRQQQLRRTLARRPDMLAQAQLSNADLAFLKTLGWPRSETNELA